MTIECFADSETPLLTPLMSVSEAVDSLRRQATPYGFVVSAGHPVGVFFPEDVLPRLDAVGAIADQSRVCEWMDPKVTWFYSDWECVEVVVSMVERGVDLALIRDRNGVIIGFIDRALLDCSGRSIPFPPPSKQHLLRIA